MLNNEPVFDFGFRLRALRKDKGLTLETASELTGISTSTLQRYENNLQEPQLSKLIALAKAYNVTLDYLAGLDRVPSFRFYNLTDEQFCVIKNLIKYFIDPINHN